MHDAVTGSIMSVNDSLISGWGMIDKLLDGEPVIDEPIIDEPVYEDTVYFSNDDLYDISNGPVFVMFAKSRTPVESGLSLNRSRKSNRTSSSIRS